jgi:alpha-soluble NSF attachment protein
MGKEAKRDQAIEKLTMAANLFNADHNWEGTANVHLRLADLYREGNRAYNAANAFLDAGNAFKSGDMLEQAFSAFDQGVRLLTATGKHSRAAKTMKAVAESLETQGEPERALEAYNKALHSYISDGKHPTQVNACKEAIALLTSKTGGYHEASELFEEIGRENLKTRVLASNARKYFYRAVLCRLAMDDVVGADVKLSDFLTADSSLQGTREAEFMQSLIRDYEGRNPDGIGASCEEYNRVRNITDWETDILLKIKTNVGGSGVGSSVTASHDNLNDDYDEFEESKAPTTTTTTTYPEGEEEDEDDLT